MKFIGYLIAFALIINFPIIGWIIGGWMIYRLSNAKFCTILAPLVLLFIFSGDDCSS